jgi:membrane protein DedA with SNARE-associated domain
MLHWLDVIVIPFLASLYGAVGYLGVAVAMAIESAMVPLPSELILPFAGFLVADPTAIEPITGAPWSLPLAVLAGTIGNTVGSLIAYAIGAYGGRPFLRRFGRYLLIREHELEIADRFFQRHGAATAFWSRLLPVVRTFISFPAGVARAPLGKFIAYSTAGAALWSLLLVWIGAQLGSRWTEIRTALAPVDTLLVVLVILGVLLALAWRLGIIAYLRSRTRS